MLNHPSADFEFLAWWFLSSNALPQMAGVGKQLIYDCIFGSSPF